MTNANSFEISTTQNFPTRKQGTKAVEFKKWSHKVRQRKICLLTNENGKARRSLQSA